MQQPRTTPAGAQRLPGQRPLLEAEQLRSCRLGRTRRRTGLVQHGGRDLHQPGSRGSRHAVPRAVQPQPASWEVQVQVKLLEQLLHPGQAGKRTTGV